MGHRGDGPRELLARLGAVRCGGRADLLPMARTAALGLAPLSCRAGLHGRTAPDYARAIRDIQEYQPMALLPFVDETTASDKTREILGNTPPKLNVARMIANASDAVFQNFSRLGNSLMTRGKLNDKLREM